MPLGFGYGKCPCERDDELQIVVMIEGDRYAVGPFDTYREAHQAQYRYENARIALVVSPEHECAWKEGVA